MLKIIINGITADLKGASKQELVFQNPMWDYEGMLGEYGLPFSLPFSPTNDRIFSNARSEFSPTMALTYLCEQYMNDDLIAEGLIVLKDTNGAYNCNFTSNLRDIFTPVSGSVMYDGYLRDILPTGPSVNPVANRNAMTTWNSIVCYPYLYNDQFYGANAPVGWNNELNSYNGTTYQNTTFVPCVAVKYILSQIAAYYGITITGDFIADSTMSRLVIFTNSAEDGATTAQLNLAVGDLTVLEFVNKIRNTFGLTGDIDLLSKNIKLDYAKKYFNNEVQYNFSSICSPIISKTSSPYQGIHLTYEIDNDDKILSDLPLDDYKTTAINYFTPNRVIKGAFSPIRHKTAPYAFKMQQNGRTTINGQSTKKVTPRIAFYSGLINLTGVILPWLNPTNNYYIFNDYTAPYGRKYNYFAAEETFWQNTFEASFQINLRKLSLSSFDIKSKVHIHGWNYLIKRIVMDCNYPEKSLLEAYRA